MPAPGQRNARDGSSDRKAGPQRAGVLSSLTLVAKSFRLLPEKDENRPVWNARTWAKKRQGWIFRSEGRATKSRCSLLSDSCGEKLSAPAGEGREPACLECPHLGKETPGMDLQIGRPGHKEPVFSPL